MCVPLILRTICCHFYCGTLQGSWLIEHPRPLAANQRLLGPGTPRAPHAIEQPEVRSFDADMPAVLSACL
jgi:hypothetical protein